MTAETLDKQDHTFSGIMFDVQAHKLPTEYLIVSSIWVRGDLGPVTIWSTEDTFRGKHTKASAWECHHKATHGSSFTELKEMVLLPPITLPPGRAHTQTHKHTHTQLLSPPINLAPGSSKGIYVHSGR